MIPWPVFIGYVLGASTGAAIAIVSLKHDSWALSIGTALLCGSLATIVMRLLYA